MRQIQFRLGLPRPRYGSLQRSPDPVAEFEGPILLTEWRGKEGEEGREWGWGEELEGGRGWGGKRGREGKREGMIGLVPQGLRTWLRLRVKHWLETAASAIDKSRSAFCKLNIVGLPVL